MFSSRNHNRAEFAFFLRTALRPNRGKLEISLPAWIAPSAWHSIHPDRIPNGYTSQTRDRWCVIRIATAISPRTQKRRSSCPGFLGPAAALCNEAMLRVISFSPTTAQKMFVSVGSASNVGEEMGRRNHANIVRWEAEHGLGAAWGNETDRAAVLVFDPDGKNRRVFASGLRNCVGLALHPRTGDLWCSVNERDELGDDLVPDFITRVQEGSFFGWPWYYLGAHEDPRHRGERPDLKEKITRPDVLIQAHSASMRIAFYNASQFPAEYQGDAFVAEHGSWNRSKRTGYKVIRVRLQDGVPSGEYEDFMTGFVVNDAIVWGRPVGVTVTHDGALLVSEDGNGTIWRISYHGQ